MILYLILKFLWSLFRGSTSSNKGYFKIFLLLNTSKYSSQLYFHETDLIQLVLHKTKGLKNLKPCFTPSLCTDNTRVCNVMNGPKEQKIQLRILLNIELFFQGHAMLLILFWISESLYLTRYIFRQILCSNPKTNCKNASSLGLE